MIDRLVGQRHAFALRTVFVLFLLLAGCQQADVGVETAVSPQPTPLPTAPPTLLPPAVISIDNTPVAPTREPWRLFESPAYGIHLVQWWHLDALERDLQMTNQMEFGWVKQTFPWRNIELSKGGYDWFRPDQIVDAVTNKYGLNLIVRIDSHPLWSVEPYLPPEEITNNQPPHNYQDFGDFCFALADRYKGQIKAYQVWNEPNLDREWGEKPPNPAEYTELLRVCYEGIKAGDPDAIVISAGLSPTETSLPDAMPDDEFLQGMYDAGAASYFDVLGLHAPGFKAPPALSPDEAADPAGPWGGHRFNAFRHVEDMRAIMVANGDANKQVAILEMGWILEQQIHQEYSWFGVTEQQQAEYLVGAYQYARENWSPWIGLMTTIYMADADWTAETHEQYWWSIVLPDGTPRLAYQALAEMEK